MYKFVKVIASAFWDMKNAKIFEYVHSGGVNCFQVVAIYSRKLGEKMFISECFYILKTIIIFKNIKKFFLNYNF